MTQTLGDNCDHCCPQAGSCWTLPPLLLGMLSILPTQARSPKSKCTEGSHTLFKIHCRFPTNHCLWPGAQGLHVPPSLSPLFPRTQGVSFQCLSLPGACWILFKVDGVQAQLPAPWPRGCDSGNCLARGAGLRQRKRPLPRCGLFKEEPCPINNCPDFVTADALHGHGSLLA